MRLYRVFTCIYVCSAKVLIFTVFYRIKWVFQEIAYLHVFLRVNHEKGPKLDPKMDPQTEAEPSKTRKNPGKMACMCRFTRVLPTIIPDPAQNIGQDGVLENDSKKTLFLRPFTTPPRRDLPVFYGIKRA